MYLYIEQWNVTEKWMDLSKEKRREFMTKVQKVMSEISDQIENLGWAMNDEHTPYRGDYRYLSVWKLPSLEAVEAFEKGIEKSDWHDYFSQANSRGKLMPMNDTIDFLVNLEKRSTSLLD